MQAILKLRFIPSANIDSKQITYNLANIVTLVFLPLSRRHYYQRYLLASSRQSNNKAKPTPAFDIYVPNVFPNLFSYFSSNHFLGQLFIDFLPSAQPTSLPNRPTDRYSQRENLHQNVVIPTSTIFLLFLLLKLNYSRRSRLFSPLCCLGLFCYRRRRTQENKCPTDRESFFLILFILIQSESMVLVHKVQVLS